MIDRTHSSFRLGLTGGIGSGKSTVAQMLGACGAAVVDADAIARSLTASGGAAMSAIVQAFGPQSIDASGALDRAYMRQLAFSQPEARQQLEGIVHPLVAQVTAQQVAQAESQGVRVIVFDIPLLVEADHWRKILDAVLVVDCTHATQIQRVMARSGLAPQAVEKIIAAQASRLARRAAADWTIFNEELSLQQLRHLVLSISAKLPL